MVGRSLCSRCQLKVISTDPKDYVLFNGEAVCLECAMKSMDIIVDLNKRLTMLEYHASHVHGCEGPDRCSVIDKSKETESVNPVVSCTSSYPPMSCYYQTIPAGCGLPQCTYGGVCQFQRPQSYIVATIKLKFENGQWTTIE